MSFRSLYTKSLRLEIARKSSAGVRYSDFFQSRLMDYRREKHSVVRLDNPSNLVRARSLGYKAKQGIFVARVRIRRGGGLFLRPKRGRKPRRMGVNKLTRRKSIQSMAEERANKRFPNTEVLNSYLVGTDGIYKYYEIILVDPSNSSILSDKDLNWMGEPQHSNRVTRGKTSAARKTRGLRKPGKRGKEKNRPSLRAHSRKSK